MNSAPVKSTVPPVCWLYQRNVAPAGPVARKVAVEPPQVVTLVLSRVGAAGAEVMVTTALALTGLAQPVLVFAAST